MNVFPMKGQTMTWTIMLGAVDGLSLLGTYPIMQQIEHLADQHAAALSFLCLGL